MVIYDPYHRNYEVFPIRIPVAPHIVDLWFQWHHFRKNRDTQRVSQGIRFGARDLTLLHHLISRNCLMCSITKLLHVQYHEIAPCIISQKLLHVKSAKLLYVRSAKLPHVRSAKLPHVRSPKLPHVRSPKFPHVRSPKFPHVTSPKLPHV